MLESDRIHFISYTLLLSKQSAKKNNGLFFKALGDMLQFCCQSGRKRQGNYETSFY